jgi:hypothetical protein
MSMNAITNRVTKSVAVAAVAVFAMAMPAPRASADTIALKDGAQARGVVVEDYTDRVVLSTVDGEITLMKSDIMELRFDDDIDNYLKLAEQASDRGRYDKAVAYYYKALEIDSESKTAKDGLMLIQLHLSGKWDDMAGQDAKRHADIDAFGASIPTRASDAEEEERSREALAGKLGMLLRDEGGRIVVYAVKPDSPAGYADIRKGDAIVAIWGRLTGYMSAKEAADRLLEKASAEIRCVIERQVKTHSPVAPGIFISTENILGASFSMEFDGLTAKRISDDGVAYGSGLRGGDLIVAINGKSTRYMPLRKAIITMLNACDSLSLTIRRKAVLWKTNSA